MKRKYKYITIQRIRKLAAKKAMLRQARKKKKKGKNEILLPPPRAPRKFSRYKKTNNSNSSINDKFSNKKNDFLERFLPENLKYITSVKESPFNLKSIRKEKYETNGRIIIPEMFSILDKPQESYTTLRKLLAALLLENNSYVTLDYINCKSTELSTQILLDIILMDVVRFQKKCKAIDRQKRNLFPAFGAININDEKVKKLIFSVGSPVNLGIQENDFWDIEKYKLRIHNNKKEKDVEKRMAQKELDTTEMVEYVINSLKRMNKKLTNDKLDDLCIVIGEILINAEEHSTTQYRFSIGYFKEEKDNENHFGLFRLVILNFGKTIYEKFKSDDCPNKGIVNRMNQLSENYTKKSWLRKGEFEEECLWTLYALQEGVTSISQDSYKRGNGSIRFIDSFFNIKGTHRMDNISRMSIVSGRTQIIFDGKYSITEKRNAKNEIFKVMTFNQSGDIEEKPDMDCVIYNKYYFPGTMISAKLLLNDDDIKQI